MDPKQNDKMLFLKVEIFLQDIICLLNFLKLNLNLRWYIFFKI